MATVAEGASKSVMEGLLARLSRLVRGDAEVFGEVAADEHATGPALQVVLAAAALEALGDGGGLAGILVSWAENVLGWTLALLVVYAGAVLLGLGRGLAPLFRALGFAALPFALGLLAPLPLLGDLAVLGQWGLLAVAFALAAAKSLEAELAVAAGLAAVGLAVGGGLAGGLL